MDGPARCVERVGVAERVERALLPHLQKRVAQVERRCVAPDTRGRAVSTLGYPFVWGKGY